METLGLVVATLKNRALDDTVDFLPGPCTSIIYALISVIVVFADLSIECFPPHFWSPAWVQAAKMYCRTAPTFVVPDELELLTDASIAPYRLKATNWYAYSFVGFNVAVFVTMVPSLLWKFTQKKNTLAIGHFLKCSGKIDLLKKEENKKKEETKEKVKERIAELAEDLTKTLFARKYSRSFPSPIFMLFMTKIIYLLLAIAQFFGIAYFLGLREDLLWSFKLARTRAMEYSWHESQLFPRIVFCEFKQRIIGGNFAERLVQCHTPYNAFHEFVFIFLSFWFAFVALVTVFGIISAAYNLISNKFIISWVQLKFFKESAEDLKEFAEKFVGSEGKLVIYFLDQNYENVTIELLAKMYEDYKFLKDPTSTSVVTSETAKPIDTAFASDPSSDTTSTEKPSSLITASADTATTDSTISIDTTVTKKSDHPLNVNIGTTDSIANADPASFDATTPEKSGNPMDDDTASIIHTIACAETANIVCTASADTDGTTADAALLPV